MRVPAVVVRVVLRTYAAPRALGMGIEGSLRRHALKRAWIALIWMCVAASGSSACTRAEGESCQLNSDCEDGLICCARSARGICATRGTEQCGQSTTDSDSDSGPDGD